MTVHPRAELRAAVLARLAPLVPSVFVKIVKARVHNFQPDDLPAAAIYTLTETSPRDAVAPKLKRTLSLIVDLHLAGGVDLDDRADALALEIEAALAGDRKFGGRAIDSQLAATNIGLNGEGERATGLCRLRFDIVYRTNADGSAA